VRGGSKQQLLVEEDQLAVQEKLIRL